MAKREYSEARARANRKYNDSHYWKPTIYIPKELENDIREQANGSVNGYILDLIKKDLENKKGTQ